MRYDDADYRQTWSRQYRWKPIQPTARSSITPWCPVWLLVGGVSVVMSYVCLYLSFIPWPEGWQFSLQADQESTWGMTIQPTGRCSITPWCHVWLLVGGVSVVMSYVCLYLSFIPWPEGWQFSLQADQESTWGMTIQPTGRSSITPWCHVWLLVGGLSVVMSYVCPAESVKYLSFIPVSSILFFKSVFSFFALLFCFGLFYISLSCSSPLSCTALSSLGLSCFIRSFSFSQGLVLFCPDFVISVLYCTVLYCTVLYCTVLYCTVLYCTVLYCTVLYCTVLYCTVLCCAVLCCAVLCCAVLCCAVLCCAVLCCAVLCCAVLCCAVLRCAVLCCDVLCCAVLCCAVLYCAVYCTVLYCTVLYCAVLCCAVLCCAVLCCAVLCCAVLCCAVLCCAVLCCAVLCCAVLY